jgi:tetratricopeptide (TPR) repeat protein
VHRDLKPSNLLVDGEHVFVVDFGLAKAIDSGASLSIEGAVLGTPAFMPPEQALGRANDARSDVYGLGATLYHCLAGTPPFAAPDLPALLRAVVDEEPPRLAADRDLDLVVQKCLEKDPERRYATAAELADDLDRWLRDEPVVARAPSWSYRLRKRLRRQRTLWRAAGVAALLTALVLVPIALRESAARTAAGEAVALADHVAAVLEDAEVHTRFGDSESAQQVLEGGITRTREFLSRHEVPRARYLLARLLRARWRTADALAELEITLAGDPDLLDARFERGLLLASLRDPSQEQLAAAVADLEAGTASPESSVLTTVDRLFGRAELLRLRGETEQAMELLAEVLEYEPTHVQARVSLSLAAIALGNDDLARYYSASAFDLHQGYGPQYVARERQSLPTNVYRLEGALVDFAPDLRSSPDNALALAHRSLVRLRRALRLAGEDRPSEAMTSLWGAIDDGRYVVRLHEEIAGAHVNLAVCQLVADRLLAASGDGAAAAAARGDAAECLDTAARIAPNLPEGSCNRGFLLLREAALAQALGRPADGRIEGAQAAFTRALAAAPAGWEHTRLCRDGLAEVQRLAQRQGAR